MYPRIVNAEFTSGGRLYPYRVDPEWPVEVGTVLRVPAPRTKSDAWVKVTVTELDVADNFPFEVKDSLGIHTDDAGTVVDSRVSEIAESMAAAEQDAPRDLGRFNCAGDYLYADGSKTPAEALRSMTAVIPGAHEDYTAAYKGVSVDLPNPLPYPEYSPLIGHDLAADLRSETPRHVAEYENSVKGTLNGLHGTLKKDDQGFSFTPDDNDIEATKPREFHQRPPVPDVPAPDDDDDFEAV